MEKIWSKDGPEFGDKQGAVVVVKKSLYGMKTAARAFHEFFADVLRKMGCTLSRADQDLRWKISSEYNGYDYISTHVDGFLIAAKQPGKYIKKIEKDFILRTVEDSPSFYLGNEIKRTDKGYLHLSCGTYIYEMLARY